MALCPFDSQPCIDDFCYGNGCLRLDGEMMLKPCEGCGKLIGLDGSDEYDECECEPTYPDDDDYRKLAESPRPLGVG